MKKFPFLAIAFLMFSACSNAQYASKGIETIHNNSHEIKMETLTDEAHCSATAIGSHTILTASHCEIPTSIMLVDEQKVTIKDVIRDGNDHTIYVLDGITFKYFANINENINVPVGEEVEYFGFPGQWPESFRKGYVAAVNQEEEVIIMDINTEKGDSGAGVYDSKGNLISVVTGMTTPYKNAHMEMTLGLFLMFTQEQLNKIV